MDFWTNRRKEIFSWAASLLPLVTFCWIWTLTLTFFVRGIDIYGANVSIIKIIYVTLALICVILFQLSRHTWQKIIIQFWAFVVLYVVFVFCLLLFFQFASTRAFVENAGITPSWQRDIGLELFEITELILFLLFELFIIVVIVTLQILFKKTQPQTSIRFPFVEKIVEILDTFFDITKLTIFGIIMTCIYKVNVMNFFIVVAAVFSMVLRRTFRYIIIQLISVIAAVLLLLQMVMQLKHFHELKNVTCTDGNTTVHVNSSQWIGLGKVQPDESMFYHVVGYLCIIALVTIHTVVIQEENIIAGLRQNVVGWNPHKMFNDTTYLEADKDFTSFIKYLFKYGFYRYGIEFTYICIVLLIQARLDVWAFLYCLWLMIFILSSNQILTELWFAFKYFLVVSIPLQYAAALGFWPEKCFGYELEKDEVVRNAFSWLHLPLGNSKPDAYKLFWDLIVFLFALCQANVFEFEKKNELGDVHGLSPNAPLQLDETSVTKPRSTFGVFRYALFSSLSTLSAVAFYLAATTTITIFSFGYGVGFSLILWSADYYFAQPSDRSQSLWTYLLVSSVVMIFIKTLLQIPACIFMDFLVQNSCWLVQLLGITCLRISTRTIAFLKVPLWNMAEIPENACWYLPASVGIEWDVFCFISLMFHNRFLRSSYYKEMATQANLNARFSNKAAKILEELNERELGEMREKYSKNLQKIHKNMQRLHQTQKRIRGIKMPKAMTHQEAVTSGDYYMFQDVDKPQRLASETEEEQKRKDEDSSPETPSVGKFMETILKSDIEQALRMTDISSSSEKLSKSSSKSSVDSEPEECFKCLCNTDEARALAAEMESAEIDVENEYASAAKTKKRSKVEKGRRTSDLITDDDKLRTTFEYRKPVLRSRTISEPSPSPPSKTDSERCSCGCVTCKCDASIWHSLRHYLSLMTKVVRVFVISCMSSLCQLFNKLSHDYKHVKKELEKEKERVKLPPTKKTVSAAPRKVSQLRSVDSSQPYQIPMYIRLLMSTHDLILSHFNTVCYLSVLLLQMKNPTLLCLPLTMMVLLWGSLSVPRPTKRFWKILITYTSSILLLECMVRSQLIQYDHYLLQSKPFQINQLYGIDKTENNSIYYLFVILAVFLQRRLLINIGLWSVDPPLQRASNMFSTGILSIRKFFQKLLYDRYNRIPADVYTHIFICDFINIFVFIFGFAAVTEKKEDGVTRYFSENKIPPAMLILFIVQCVMIFIDRWIYLRRHVVAKLVFQIIQIAMIHFCLFLLLPAATFRRFNHLFFPSLWYIIKCIYLLLSAYQIRCGYPASVHGHALCQSYNVVNMYMYQFYLIFPFVYELRTVTDWMWTETTLTLSEWVGMEDIFCTVFQCWRNYDNKYSYQRGQKITSTIKFVVGGGVVLMFFFVLLFPLAFFAFGRVAGEINIPQQMKIEFRIESYQSIFNAFSSDIRSLTATEWYNFKDLYRYYPRAITFLSEYDANDVGIVRFSNYSTIEWNVSPFFEEELKRLLQSEKPLKLLAEWSLSRKTENTRQSNIVNGYQSVFLSQNARDELHKVVLKEGNTLSVDNIFPKFLKVSSVSTAYPVDALMIHYDGSPIPSFGNLTFQTSESGTTICWQAFENYEHPKNLILSANNVVSEQNDEISVFTFNDKIFPPGIFSYFSAQGIIGLYTSFLISLGFIIRRLCRGRTNQVFLDYLPNVDSILQLLLDIYFVREHKDGKLEEDLYAKLIFLFRSPETLIRWTRMPEDPD